jgi:hypothetical protein
MPGEVARLAYFDAGTFFFMVQQCWKAWSLRTGLAGASISTASFNSFLNIGGWNCGTSAARNRPYRHAVPHCELPVGL